MGQVLGGTMVPGPGIESQSVEPSAPGSRGIRWFGQRLGGDIRRGPAGDFSILRSLGARVRPVTCPLQRLCGFGYRSCVRRQRLNLPVGKDQGKFASAAQFELVAISLILPMLSV